MNGSDSKTRMRLHRLQVRHDPDPHWPLDPEPTLPGFLEVTLGECSHLMFCPDVVTLLTCLWDAQQYRALGQTLRPALYESRSARVARGPGSPDSGSLAGGGVAFVRLEAVREEGAVSLGELELPEWQRLIAGLAGEAADVLAVAGERGLAMMLAPVLAGPRPGAADPRR